MPHTPGPWKKVNDCTVRGPHGEAVASTKGFAYPADVNHDANARLIAAAPELLAMLKELLDAPRVRGFSERSSSRQDRIQDVSARAAAVVAKAEGRSEDRS